MPESKQWILLTFFAMLFILYENFCISLMGQAGPFQSLYYLAPGQFLASFASSIFLMVMNYRKNGNFWIN